MTSRPAMPESDTPETNALARLDPLNVRPQLIDLARSLERRLSLAQTELKGHMRVKDDLDRRIAELEKALKIIERWSEFPATGDFHEGGTPVSYGAAFGSNGERDYMRSIAKEALKSRA